MLTAETISQWGEPGPAEDSGVASKIDVLDGSLENPNRFTTSFANNPVLLTTH